MEILHTFWLLGQNLAVLGQQLFPYLLSALVPIAWIAFWLCAVDWRKACPALTQGAWAPLVLIMVIAALVWSRISPSQFDLWGLAKLPNFWWQLAAVGLLVGVAFFCGWLQLYFQRFPPEISFDPPVSHDAHGHDSHGHGHESHGHSTDSGHGVHH
jgi:ABC-type nickel/cobalt efflux system permease component RcnA